MICPRCGKPARGTTDETVPVIHPENGRNLGWSRTIRTWHHEQSTCQMATGLDIPPPPPPDVRITYPDSTTKDSGFATTE